VLLDRSQKSEILGLLRSASYSTEGKLIDLAELDGVPDEELSHRYAERATVITGKDALNTLEALWERQPLLILGIILSTTV